MCGRYNIHDDPWLQTLLRELGVEMRIPTRVNIAPTEAVPVVIEEQGRRCLRQMRWWLVPSWAPEIDQRYSMFNAKAETLGTSRAFRGPLRHRRCILPASSFIEWTPVDGHKQPWLIRPERGAIAFAGLWDVWEKDGNHLESCAIITTGAAPGIDRLHNRMPVILRERDFARWLDVETPLGDPSDILHSRLPHPFVLAPVSPAVNNSRHKSEALLAPVGEEERVEAVGQ
jgi:putative SOS response-associated peptidase YedK